MVFGNEQGVCDSHAVFDNWFRCMLLLQLSLYYNITGESYRDTFDQVS